MAGASFTEAYTSVEDPTVGCIVSVEFFGVLKAVFIDLIAAAIAIPFKTWDPLAEHDIGRQRKRTVGTQLLGPAAGCAGGSQQDIRCEILLLGA